ncbi:MAG: 30S ribosomal protein S8 [Desulfobacteraceae bacterium]
MAMSDPIADMLTRIRNSGKAEFAKVDIPGSKLKIEIARVLKEQGFIKNYKFVEDDKQGLIRIYMKYAGEKKPAIYGLKRISKPGRRVYSKAKEIQPVLNGLGISIVSTSKGLMTDKQAREMNLGGEVLCNIW